MVRMELLYRPDWATAKLPVDSRPLILAQAAEARRIGDRHSPPLIGVLTQTERRAGVGRGPRARRQGIAIRVRFLGVRLQKQAKEVARVVYDKL